MAVHDPHEWKKLSHPDFTPFVASNQKNNHDAEIAAELERGYQEGFAKGKAAAEQSQNDLLTQQIALCETLVSRLQVHSEEFPSLAADDYRDMLIALFHVLFEYELQINPQLFEKVIARAQEYLIDAEAPLRILLHSSDQVRLGRVVAQSELNQYVHSDDKVPEGTIAVSSGVEMVVLDPIVGLRALLDEAAVDDSIAQCLTTDEADGATGTPADQCDAV